jgi:hypothetical protein
MKRFGIAVALGVCLLGGHRAFAAGQDFTVSPAAGPVVLDGRLDDAVWRTATAIPLAFEYFPGDNAPARVSTICRVTFDESRLYIGCDAADPEPGAIRATLADRDVPREDDTIGFLIDPFHDGRRAFQFRVNARGVQMDSVVSDIEGGEDWSWDAIWDAKAQITTGGYTVEAAVPFSSLRFPRATGVQTWGFMATRDMPRSSRIRIRSARVDRNRSCLICQLDSLTGFVGIAPGRNLELDPTFTVARTDRRDTLAGPLAGGDPRTDLGLSARWSPRSNIAVSGTANPDFYQVEADAAQLDVNTQFQLRFAEKRPFFLEGADLFRTPIEAVFTRTIADPTAGIKVSGKQGHHAFGAFVARDDVTGVLVPGYEGSSFTVLNRPNTSSVLRYRRDLGASGSTLGLLATDREAGDYANRVGGIDGILRPSRADSIRFQWLVSQTDYPDALATSRGQRSQPFTGQAIVTNYAHRTRNWFWNGQGFGIAPGFRADSGFLPQAEMRGYAAGVGRIFLGRSWFNELTLSTGCDRATDWRNARASWGCDNSIDYNGPKQFEINYNAAPNYNYYRGQTFSNFRHNLDVSIRPSGAVSLFLDSSYGYNVDFANARRARATRYTAGTTLNAFARLTGEVTLTEQRFSTEARQRIFIARLTQGQANYHFTPRAFARVILQYTDVSRNAAAYLQPVPPATRRLFSQLLFSYKVNPQSVLLAGYSDNADGGTTPDLVRTDRTFFLKVGYAFLR